MDESVHDDTACGLCSESLGPELFRSEYWRLILNRNQNLLGKCFLVTLRHTEVVAELSPDEWAELRDDLIRATAALNETFQPDHFNYAFLQNQDRHVHFHLIPRYAGPRQWADLTFTDPTYPEHYDIAGPGRVLPAATASELGDLLSDAATAPSSLPS